MTTNLRAEPFTHSHRPVLNFFIEDQTKMKRKDAWFLRWSWKSRHVPSCPTRWFLPLAQLQEITHYQKSTTSSTIYNLQQAAGHSITATPVTKNTLMYKLNHLHLSVKGNKTLIHFFKLTVQCFCDGRHKTVAQIPNTKMYSNFNLQGLDLSIIKTLALFFYKTNKWWKSSSSSSGVTPDFALIAHRPLKSPQFWLPKALAPQAPVWLWHWEHRWSLLYRLLSWQRRWVDAQWRSCWVMA